MCWYDFNFTYEPTVSLAGRRVDQGGFFRWHYSVCLNTGRFHKKCFLGLLARAQCWPNVKYKGLVSSRKCTSIYNYRIRSTNWHDLPCPVTNNLHVQCVPIVLAPL